MAQPTYENCLVIPDSHGERDKIAQVINAYEADVDSFVFLGDVLGGPDSRGLISLIRSLGDRAVALAGNHEWACRNALTEEENEYAQVWHTKIWPHFHADMLDSYGLKFSTSLAGLHAAMAETGDLEWLNSLPAYLETDTFIALHAGPELDTPWAAQADYLDQASTPENRLEEEPDQIFSHKLAAVASVPISVENRPFVTGHDHLLLPRDQRSTERRVRLASALNRGQPLYVWRSSDQTIHEH